MKDLRGCYGDSCDSLSDDDVASSYRRCCSCAKEQTKPLGYYMPSRLNFHRSTGLSGHIAECHCNSNSKKNKFDSGHRSGSDRPTPASPASCARRVLADWKSCSQTNHLLLSDYSLARRYLAHDCCAIIAAFVRLNNWPMLTGLSCLKVDSLLPNLRQALRHCHFLGLMIPH